MTELKDPLQPSKEVSYTPDLEASGVETRDEIKLRIAREAKQGESKAETGISSATAQETSLRQEGEMLLSVARENLEAIEQSLGRAANGQEPIVQGGIEQLRVVAATLRKIKDFLNVL